MARLLKKERESDKSDHKNKIFFTREQLLTHLNGSGTRKSGFHQFKGNKRQVARSLSLIPKKRERGHARAAPVQVTH